MASIPGAPPMTARAYSLVSYCAVTRPVPSISVPRFRGMDLRALLARLQALSLHHLLLEAAPVGLPVNRNLHSPPGKRIIPSGVCPGPGPRFLFRFRTWNLHAHYSARRSRYRASNSSVAALRSAGSVRQSRAVIARAAAASSIPLRPSSLAAASRNSVLCPATPEGAMVT